MIVTGSEHTYETRSAATFTSSSNMGRVALSHMYDAAVAEEDMAYHDYMSSYGTPSRLDSYHAYMAAMTRRQQAFDNYITSK